MTEKVKWSSQSRRAFDQSIRPTRVQVDLSALRHNLAVAKRLAGSAQILAVVKANAYGHGALLVSRALEEEGVGFLGVALIEEGLELRHGGIQAPILVLGGAYQGGYEQMAKYNLTPAVFRPEHLEKLAAVASALGRAIDVHLKIDTGMGRIGLAPSELNDFLDCAQRLPYIKLDGVLSHFANADLSDASVTQRQLEQFLQACEQLRARKVHPRWFHISNSAGVVTLPKVSDGRFFNLVRPGIMLYGLLPTPGVRPPTPLRPVLSWTTQVIHLKSVPAGTAISYGGTWVARRPSTIATLPVGYADGYSRKFSNQAHVLIRGKRAPIAGRVCMDLCMVDVTEIKDAAVGDEAVLVGAQGSETVSAEELALLAETIHYEILCGISSRVPRVEKH